MSELIVSQDTWLADKTRERLILPYLRYLQRRGLSAAKIHTPKICQKICQATRQDTVAIRILPLSFNHYQPQPRLLDR